MKTNRIVIDTNVIVSALIFSKTSLIYNININHGDRFGCSKFCKSSLPHRV